MERNYRKYLLFWFSQTVSQLGSRLTSLALILWVYTQTESAMTFSLMAFCNYVPYIVVSLFAGAFVDQHRKKRIMLLSDSIAALCSLFILLMWYMQGLQIWHIYVVNFIIGFMSAFPSPASSVTLGLLVPKEKLARVSGLNSFSESFIQVLAPVCASVVFAFGGLGSVLAIDFTTFLFAFIILAIWIHIPEEMKKEKQEVTAFAGCKMGFQFLLQHKGLWYIVITMAVLNFFSRLTYENILSPMLLARSGNNSLVFGIVNATIGIGGIVGGILVSTGRTTKKYTKMIYVSAALSFLLGDILMGLGRTPLLWCLAGIGASLPIPFIMAGENVILYQRIPQEIQGRIFAVRNAIQFSTIPLGILLGGFLAEYVFEPFMNSNSVFANALHYLVGTGEGSGMAVMFLCTGTLGSLFSLWVYSKKEIRILNEQP